MAAYKFDTLAVETVAWAMGANEIEVSVALTQELTDFFGSGDWTPVRDGLSILTVVKVNGKAQRDSELQPVDGHPTCTHRIGPVGLTAARAEAIEKAEAIIQAHPAWIAKQAATAAGRAASREYDSHAKAVDKMMRPGGSY